MKIIGLDGKEYKLKLKEADISDDNRSKGHLKCRKFLKELYPSDRIFEEIELPGTKGLVADFVILLRKLLIEVHGQQHYNFSSYFHKNLIDFEKAKIRDRAKKEWADLNGFIYVALNDKHQDQWKNQLLGAFDDS